MAVVEKIVCPMCGAENTEKDLYIGKSEIYAFYGKIPFCKPCIEKIFKKYLNEYKDNKKAIYLMCQRLDVPFKYSAYEGASKVARAKKMDVYKTYFIKLNSLGNANNYGNCFDDSDKWIDGDEPTNTETEFEVESDFELTPEIVRFFGKGYKKDEYEFLYEYYNELIKMYDHSLPVQVNNYRNMAKTQLQANKCLESGDMNGYDKAMKILSLLSGDSNIKPVQETSAGNVSKGGFDVFIKHIEDEEPILDWEKDFGHVNKLKSMLNVFFFGNLARALNIKNPWQSEFDEEIKKYTVEDTEVEEEKNQVDFLEDK